MIALPRRAFTLWSIAALIMALATMGGYRLHSSAVSGPRHVRLATTVNQTWVSRSGDDGNAALYSCIFAHPCQSFYSAQTVTQPGGVIDVLDSGNFGGTTISHAVTIDGTGANAFIAASNPAIRVMAGPNDVVVLRHLQIEGAGYGSTGIIFQSGKALILDDVTIDGFSQQGISVQLTTPGSLTIINSRIQNNGGTGVAITPSGATVQTTIRHSEITNNYYGIIGQDGTDVSLTDSVVNGNTSIGVGCQTFGSGACTIQTESDRLDHNWAAIWMNHGAGTGQITMSLSNDAVFGNSYGIYGDFGGTLNAATFSNNRFVNNFVDGAASSTMTQK